MVTGYKVLYLRADSNVGVANAASITTAGSEHSALIRNLYKWTQYKIWVLAFTQIGDGPKSDLIIVQTDEDGM